MRITINGCTAAEDHSFGVGDVPGFEQADCACDIVVLLANQLLDLLSYSLEASKVDYYISILVPQCLFWIFFWSNGLNPPAQSNDVLCSLP